MRKYISIDRGRQARNIETGEIGKIVTGSNQKFGDCGSVRVEITDDDGNKRLSEDMDDAQFNEKWEVLNYAVNKRGEKIEVGSFWFMPCNFFGRDESWIALITNIGQYGVGLHYVNWKRKGDGSNHSFMIDEFFLNNEGATRFRPANHEQIEYFHKRTKDRYKTETKEEAVQIELL